MSEGVENEGYTEMPRYDGGSADAPIDLAKALEEAEAMMDGPEKDAAIKAIEAEQGEGSSAE